ncbi:MAG: hypothetical protein NC324_00615 [Bacteroides sp.]|nr:hypothetical protein [Bacteroides sp.]
MLFNSVSFIFLFLPLVLLLYHTIDRFRFRGKDLTLNLLLLVFSLVFFCWAGFKVAVKTVPALVSIVLWNYLAALLSDKWKPSLIIGVLGNIAFFFYYRIWNELAKLIDGILSSGLTIEKLIVPIGLSFILFHGISYLLDIRHGKAKPNKNFAEFALYMVFFPKLAQGPIVKYYEFEPYLKHRYIDLELFVSGVERFIIGLGKKVLLADILAVTVHRIFMPPYNQLDVVTAWIGSVLFTLQIYLDFSGYSDMAIGVGRMFGFQFKENFNFPYHSTSISEFWRRWHISLGSWFREYLYIPLGGSRSGNVYFNLFLVFLITGIWHGSTLPFLLWGVAHGLCVMMERFLVQKGWYEKIPKVFRWLYTMLVVNLGWIVFRVQDMQMFKLYLKRMLGIGIDKASPDFSWTYYFTNRGSILALIAILGILFGGNARVQDRFREWDNHSVSFAIVKAVLLILLFIVAVSGSISSTYNPFLYFRF